MAATTHASSTTPPAHGARMNAFARSVATCSVLIHPYLDMSRIYFPAFSAFDASVSPQSFQRMRAPVMASIR